MIDLRRTIHHDIQLRGKGIAIGETLALAAIWVIIGMLGHVSIVRTCWMVGVLINCLALVVLLLFGTSAASAPSRTLTWRDRIACFACIVIPCMLAVVSLYQAQLDPRHRLNQRNLT